MKSSLNEWERILFVWGYARLTSNSNWRILNAMSSAKITLGKHGERLAAHHLMTRGYTILNTNWRCQLGEIDIIAQYDQILVFVEVRTRHAPTPDMAFESITRRKQDKLATLAETYLNQHELENQSWRIDVIAIAVLPNGKTIIEHAEDALGWT